MLIQTIINDVVTLVVGVGSVYAIMKKKFPKTTEAVVQEVEHNLPHKVLTDLEAGVKFIEHLAQSPFFAASAAKGKLEAHHVIGKLEDLTALSEAKTLLQKLGAYASLSATDKAKAGAVLKLNLLHQGITVSDKQIEDFFTQADAALTALEGDKTFATLFEKPADPQPAQQA